MSDSRTLGPRPSASASSATSTDVPTASSRSATATPREAALAEPFGAGPRPARHATRHACRCHGRGERVTPNPRLSFGEAADRWLAEQVSELRPATQAIYRNSVETHLRPRWGRPAPGLDRGRRRRTARPRTPRARARGDGRSRRAQGGARVQVRPPALRVAWREPAASARERGAPEGKRDARAAHLRRGRAGADPERGAGAMEDAVQARERRRRPRETNCSACGGRTSI